MVDTKVFIITIVSGILFGLLLILIDKYYSNKQSKKEIRDLFPKDFLIQAFSGIVYHKNNFKIKIEGWEVCNVYFVGATLCLDIENKNLEVKDVITVCSDNTFGLFSGEGIYKRSELNKSEIELFNQIKTFKNKE